MQKILHNWNTPDKSSYKMTVEFLIKLFKDIENLYMLRISSRF